MNKLIVLGLLFGLLHAASASRINCNNNDLKKCSTEVGRALDEEIRDAHISMVKKIVENHIDVCREMKKQCKADDKNCNDTIDKIVHEQKDELEKLDEQEDDQKAQLATMKRLLGNVKKETLKTVLSENDIKKVDEHKNLEAIMTEVIREFVREVLWHSKETAIELKEKNIQMDDVVQQIDEMQRATQSTEDDIEKMEKVIDSLEKLSEKLDMPWTEAVNNSNEKEPMKKHISEIHERVQRLG